MSFIKIQSETCHVNEEAYVLLKTEHLKVVNIVKRQQVVLFPVAQILFHQKYI